MKYFVLASLTIFISVHALAEDPIRIRGNLADIIKTDNIVGFRTMLNETVKDLERECELFASNDDEAESYKQCLENMKKHILWANREGNYFLYDFEFLDANVYSTHIKYRYYKYFEVTDWGYGCSDEWDVTTFLTGKVLDYELSARNCDN